MESFKVQAHVGSDGVLRLEVPTQSADADLEVELKLVQSQARSSWPPHFFSEVIGSWEGEYPPRNQGEYEVRED